MLSVSIEVALALGSPLVGALIWLIRLEAVAKTNAKDAVQQRDNVVQLFKTTASHDTLIATTKLKVETATTEAARASAEIEDHKDKCVKGSDRLWNALEGPGGITGRVTVLETRALGSGDD